MLLREMEPAPPDEGEPKEDVTEQSFKLYEEIDMESEPLVARDEDVDGSLKAIRRPWWHLPILPLLILSEWLARLSDAFGSRFVFAVIIVYGISQGIGEMVGGFSSKYFWKDVMRVSPAESQVSWPSARKFTCCTSDH